MQHSIRSSKKTTMPVDARLATLGFVGSSLYPDRRPGRPPSAFAWLCIGYLAAILALIFH